MAEKPKQKPKKLDSFNSPISPSKSDKTKVPEDKKQDMNDIEAPQFSNLESASDQEDSDKEMGEEKKEESKTGLKRVDSRFQIQREQKRRNTQLLRPEFVLNRQASQEDLSKNEKIWELMASYIGNDTRAIQRGIVNHIEYTLACTRFNFRTPECYQATAHSIKDRLIESFNDTNQHQFEEFPKRVCYLSLEYLLGRLMQNSLINIDMEEEYRNALMDIGHHLEDLYEEEVDPALGNGGLGRLAACFLDSLATLNIPAWGYGIRYNYGIFKQTIVNGRQAEIPDYWLANGNPWEIQRKDVRYPIRFYGRVEKYKDNKGVERSRWLDGEIVFAIAYDIPVPGYNTFNTNNLRLWSSAPTTEFDFKSFNEGNYYNAVEARQRAENITSVLYPNDSTPAGKELRLKQQYFFVCATIRDLINHFKNTGKPWTQFPKKQAIQLNDTHPAIAIVELLRVLIDQEMLDYMDAWKIVYETFSYTNHTVLPEALEKWSVDLIGHLLPRHLELIYLVNFYFLERIQKDFPGQVDKLTNMSIIEESSPKKVRMANLSIIGSHKVNGVAALHTKLLKSNLFPDFNSYYPKKFINKTNGVTPRRWIYSANRPLATLYTERMGGEEEWLTNLDLLTNLTDLADDDDFQQEWIEVRRINKLRLKKWVKEHCDGLEIPDNAIYEVMAKRFHQYKRQLMNILYVIHRYLQLKQMSPSERQNEVPHVTFFAGKAAPGYVNAKHVIHLINAVAAKINHDPDTRDYQMVVFLPNYSVSNAQVIIPGSDLNQQISTAGLEASGTGNMKFCMNGSLIIGTMDGANVEIAEKIGEENMFIFGTRVEQVEQRRNEVRGGKKLGSRLKSVCDAIFSGRFGDLNDMKGFLGEIMGGNDYYLVTLDFYEYLEAQKKVDECYKKPKEWWAKSIRCATQMGFFSSDRTIQEYCDQIWKVQPYKIPHPQDASMTRVRSYPNMR